MKRGKKLRSISKNQDTLLSCYIMDMLPRFLWLDSYIICGALSLSFLNKKLKKNMGLISPSVL